MSDLLEQKITAFRETNLFSNAHELIRTEICNIYENYIFIKQRAYYVSVLLKKVIKAFNLPIPFVLIDLLEKVETQKEVEFLYNPWQRDHLLHSLNLFSLGSLLITRFPCIEDVLNSCSRSDRLRKWAFCSILHDIGYIENCKDELRDDLISSLKSNFEKPRFQAVCTFGYYHDLTFDLESKSLWNEPEIVELMGPASHVVEREFLSPQSSIGTGATIYKGGNLYRLFSKTHSDHGVVSATILSLCKRISESILKNPNHMLRGEILSLWIGLENPLQAISDHNESYVYREDMTAINPWLSFLHLLDELTDYDRRFLDAENPGQITSINDYRLESNNGNPIFYYPKSCENRIADKNLDKIAGEYGILVRC
jgi:hypothetical protein